MKGNQSFTNLLKNGNFESWSAGTAAAPDGWTLTGTGAAVERFATSKIGTYSVLITYGSDPAKIYQDLTASDYAYLTGRSVTIGVWVKTGTANQARIEVPGAGTPSTYHSGSNVWELLTTTYIPQGGDTVIRVNFVLNIAGQVLFDGAILVEGSVIPAFSERPLYDDGKTLVIDSATNSITSGSLAITTTDAANATALTVTQQDTGSSIAATIVNAGTGNGLFIDQNGNGVALHIDNDGTANSLTVEGTTATDFVIEKGGNVGIGTISPATKLDIAGAMQVSSTVALSLGGYVRTFAEATGTPSGTTTYFDISVDVPSGCKLLGCQLRVDTALTAGETWGAAYVTGSTTTLAAAGQAVAQNTKVNKMHVDEITTDTTKVRITRDAGNFTNAAGVIRAIVYYETFTAMGNAA